MGGKGRRRLASETFENVSKRSDLHCSVQPDTIRETGYPNLSKIALLRVALQVRVLGPALLTVDELIFAQFTSAPVFTGLKPPAVIVHVTAPK